MSETPQLPLRPSERPAALPDIPQSAAGRESTGPARHLDSSVAFRVIRLIELVSSRDGPIGVREAGRLTGIDRSAVSRVFAQLEQLEYVQKALDGSGYTVGPALFSTAAAVRGRDSLWKASQPILEALVAEHDETAYLTVRRGDHVVYVDRVECRQTIRYVVELGTAFPLISGAAGRAILSTFSDEDLARVLTGGFEPFTDQSFSDSASLLAELAIDRARGVSLSAGRFVANGAGVAAPYFDDSGACVGALVVSGPADRMPPQRMQALSESVRAAAEHLSHRLGHRSSAERVQDPLRGAPPDA